MLRPPPPPPRPQWPTIVKPETWPKGALYRANTMAGGAPAMQQGQSPAGTNSS